MLGGGTEKIEDMAVISDMRHFNAQSGNWLERLIFNNRFIFIVFCILVTLPLVYQAFQVKLTPSFEKMIPHNNPYIQNYFKLKGELAGLGNVVRIVVENKEGTIYDPGFLSLLREINDEIMLTPGTDRAWQRSLWMPGVRWNSVTEVGFLGGPVMPPHYDGSKESLAILKGNITKANLVGSLVGLDNKSAMIIVPLLEKNNETGNDLDYSAYAARLEKLREKETDKYKIHIIGFAKLVGDLMDGLVKVMFFFVAAILITGVIIFLYIRCFRSTVTLIFCSIIAVLWQLGLVATFGFSLDPYSILVPFLIFAIGVSHGSQKMNGIMQDIGRGTHQLIAARYTFRRLFMAGLTALITDTVGFALLMLIDIPIIRNLAVAASIGVAVLIFTNLLLLPVMLSFVGVCPGSAERSLRDESDEDSIVAKVTLSLSKITDRPVAGFVLMCTVIIALVGFHIRSDLPIGDLDPGAPELRPDSRYNRDNQYITSHYSLSSDVFAIMVKSPPRQGTSYQALIEMDRLEWELRQLPGVQATMSAAGSIKALTAGTGEGSPKWFTLSRDQKVLNFGSTWTLQNHPELANTDVSVLPIIAYLKDHKAETLKQVIDTCENFAEKHDTENRKFLLAAGTAGIEAATNIEVEKANRSIMIYVYLSIIILCFVTFRNWRAVVVAVVPLGITSILCEALMVKLGIGVKVATLPVIALGVGTGVDYALYLVSVQIKHQKEGDPLNVAYLKALRFTGKIVALIGVTLAGGVITWVFSPIKFQADMGILLGFMFLWNMVGALIIIPALSCFVMRTRWISKKNIEGKRSKLNSRKENKTLVKRDELTKQVLVSE